MEHRWGHRIAVDVPVRLVLSRGGIVWGRMRNVSMTGAFVQSTQTLPAGALVSIEPTSRSGAWPFVARSATVIRVCDEGTGLEWCEPVDSPTLWKGGSIHPQGLGVQRV